VTVKLGKIGCKFLAREFRRDFVRSDHDNFFAWRFIKVTCQMYDVNLTSDHVLLM